MKIRTDFVTNSSSSSFVVEVEFSLVNGDTLTFVGNGASGESGPIDYFKNEAHVTVSPKQLGNSKNIEELISLMASGIKDVDYDEEVSIFEKSYVVEDTLGKKRDAHKFVKIMEDKIGSMDNIQAITVAGTKFSGINLYSKRYTYDLKSKKYTGTIYGKQFESEGCPGQIELEDLKTCKIDHKENLDKWYDGTPDSKLDRLMRSVSASKKKRVSIKKYKRYGIRFGFNFVDGTDMVFYDCSSSKSPYAMNFFKGKVKFNVSPKQLGACKSLKEIEKKLIDIVVDFDGKTEQKIFEPVNMRPNLSMINSIEDIDSIFISYKGWDEDESFDFYEATYTYYMEDSFYCGEILNPQYADKVDKVLLELPDLNTCDVDEIYVAGKDEAIEEPAQQVPTTSIKESEVLNDASILTKYSTAAKDKEFFNEIENVMRAIGEPTTATAIFKGCGGELAKYSPNKISALLERMSEEEQTVIIDRRNKKLTLYALAEEERKRQEEERKRQEEQRKLQKQLKGKIELSNSVRRFLCVEENAIAVVTKDGKVLTHGLQEDIKREVESWEDIKQVCIQNTPVFFEIVYVVGLRYDGTVVFTGNMSDKIGIETELSCWRNITKIFCSYRNIYGIDHEGKVFAVGDDSRQQLKAKYWNGITKIVGRPQTVVGLDKNGDLQRCGDSFYGSLPQKREHKFIDVSFELGGTSVYALENVGTVLSPHDDDGVSAWNNVIAIEKGALSILGVTADGKVKLAYERTVGKMFSNTSTWNKVIYAAGNKNAVVAITEDGYVKVSGVNDFSARMKNVRLFEDCREIPAIEKERIQRMQEQERNRVQSIKKKVADLEQEMCNVKGLFAGMKKKKIQKQIDELKGTI